MIRKRTIYPSVLIIYIILWTIINLFLLSGFPFMHTDEAWLAGLSRAILIDNNPAATEPFFNLTERAPHALKILFHIIQTVFISFFGYSLFSIRLFSLLSGTACLFVFGKLCKRLELNSLYGTILLSMQIQFIYASHFGRQEVQILLLMLLSIYFAVSESDKGLKRGLLCGLPIAIAVGFHPNAFIAAWPAGLFLLSEIIRKKRSITEGLGFLILPAVSAVLFIVLSLSFNSGFVSDYSSFGEDVGAMETFDIKLLGLDDFYQKLFFRVSGTYYTPRIWPVFILAAISVIILIFSRLKKLKLNLKAVSLITAGLLGVNAGILLIGKYSAPSVIFLIPFLILLITAALTRFSSTAAGRVLFIIPAAVLLLNTILMINEEAGGNHEQYSDFTEQIQSAIPRVSTEKEALESRVLGPLTTEFCFYNGRLLDWRNLTVLRDAGISLEDYLSRNNIEYVIYTGEYDLIYSQRPVWNILYGNPVIYHEPLQIFLSKNCELISEFGSPGYGTRIVMHRFKKEWMVRVYRVIR